MSKLNVHMICRLNYDILIYLISLVYSGEFYKEHELLYKSKNLPKQIEIFISNLFFPLLIFKPEFWKLKKVLNVLAAVKITKLQ